MPGTHTQILLHVVYSTKQRQPWITPDVAERLYPYIGGIIRAERGVLYDIGGVADHVHLYLRWRPDENDFEPAQDGEIKIVALSASDVSESRGVRLAGGL
jgi:REP element-mobilizing transposase RayT